MQTSDLAIQYTIDGSAPIVVRLIQAQMIVGASSQADIRIESPFMSRQHFLIEQQDNRLYVTDLGSSNGTMLQGRRLAANTRHEWLPGQALNVANIRFELVTPQLSDTEPTIHSGGLLSLIAEPAEISAGQQSRLTLNYQGNTPQMIYLRSDTNTDGLDVSISPDQVYVQPGQVVFADVKTRKTKTYWTGGKFSVALVALTNSGEDTLTELMVSVRPRYEILLLFLLLLFAGGLGIAAALPQLGVQLAPTSTPTLTATASPTVTATLTVTASATPTITATLTETPSPTPSDTPTPTATLFPTSTQIPSREPTNTPFIIIVTQPVIVPLPVPVTVIVSPVTPVTPITPVTPDDPLTACAGFVGRSPVEGLPNGPVTFFWDAPTSGGAVSYRLTVSNLDSGQSTSVNTGFGVTSATVDVGQRALGSGFRFRWQVTAQLIDGRPCTAPAVNLLREAPPNPDPAIEPPDNCLPGYAPCPDNNERFPGFQASSLVPDLNLFTQTSTDTAVKRAIEAVSNGVMLLFGAAIIGYEIRRRRTSRTGQSSVDQNER